MKPKNSEEIKKSLGFSISNEEKKDLAKCWATWKKSRSGLLRNYKNWENFVFEETDLNVKPNQLFLYWSKQGKEKGVLI